VALLENTLAELGSAAAVLDAADPLADFRDRFLLPENVIYLDGNSLGSLPRDTPRRVADAVETQWGQGLITSWNNARWIDLPTRVGDKIARLIGARAGEVIACDSTSVNLFKVLTATLSLRPGRTVLLSERGNFPTDVYMMQGVEGLTGGAVEARLVAPEDIEAALGDDVAVLLLTQVHYKTGELRDLARTTALAQAAGALVIWDLSHSAGALPVDLTGANADFAVGCGYKYLNGGPGAPAWLYAARRHHDVEPALSGWFGHAAPFRFRDDYVPAPGIARFLCGTPPVLGLIALEAGVELLLDADMHAIRDKSLRLRELFTRAMEALCRDFGFALAGPTDPDECGSQIAYAHPEGYAIVQALIARGVIGDFREPDIVRFGLTPLTLSYSDVVRTVEIISEVMASRAWDRPEHRVRAAVT
jgi:kynureninase